MQGSSRAAVARGQEVLDAVLSGGPGGAVAGRPDAAALAEDLFGVESALGSSAALRRALTDPTREAAAKAELVSRLLTGKVSNGAVQVVRALVEQRWSAERDLVDAIEGLAVEALAAGAEQAGRADAVEDELFRFERLVAANPPLREAVTDRRADPAAKRDLVTGLLAGKASPETVRLAAHAATGARGQRFDRAIEDYLKIIARRRRQLSATVTSAIDLDPSQRERLASALGSIYGTTVHLNVVLDPQILGGIRVQIGDEVVDGTVLRKLEGARRLLGG
jgi:F-type H+-transporting ATPase subunit delta